MPKVCSGCQGENVVQAAECEECGQAFTPPAPSRKWPRWGLIAIVGIAGIAAWGAIAGSGEADQEVMTNVAEKACERAVERTGLTGDFVHRVTEDGDDWDIVTTVNSNSGLFAFQCTAVRDGETVRARVELLE